MSLLDGSGSSSRSDITTGGGSELLDEGPLFVEAAKAADETCGSAGGAFSDFSATPNCPIFTLFFWTWLCEAEELGRFPELTLSSSAVEDDHRVFSWARSSSSEREVDRIDENSGPASTLGRELIRDTESHRGCTRVDLQHLSRKKRSRQAFSELLHLLFSGAGHPGVFLAFRRLARCRQIDREVFFRPLRVRTAMDVILKLELLDACPNKIVAAA